MAPRTSHPAQGEILPSLTSSAGVRRKTPPRACTTPPRSSKRSRTSPRRATPPRSAAPRTSPSRQLSSHLARKMVELWVAVEAGDVEEVAQLVQETGPAVTRGSTGYTLLHVAAANNQPEVVKWLLQLLNPNLVNKAGLTPAHLAAMKGHTQVLRLLLDDPHLDHLARDPAGNTYRHWLCVPLFEAVLRWDRKKVQDLVGVGAHPDVDGGRVVGGALVRELRVTTARQLATTLGREAILRLFPQSPPLQQLDTPTSTSSFSTCTQEGQTQHIDQLPVGSLRLPVILPSPVDAVHTGVNNDVYSGSGAYVTILSYASFPGQPHLDLPTSHTGAHNLASVFTKMGYSGHAHMNLTEKQTRQVLAQVRDMEELDSVGCAIFVVASHGTPNQHFLTSDGHLLDTRWLCDLFKDSQCPRLKNKPKLFIFDLCCGHYRQQGEVKKGRGQNTRVEEPLRDTVCLYSNSGELTWYSSSRDGTPFSSSLCRTIAQQCNQELGDLYRNFLSHYNSMAPTAAPHLRNVGFNKRFYFTSAPSTI